MKKFLCFFTTLFLATFFLQCSDKVVVGSDDDPVVTIEDVWFSHEVDKDGDGFASYARLNFDLDTNVEEFSVVIKVGKKYHSNVTGDYDVYFQSVAFTISGATTSDAVYIDIGDPNEELDKGNYDFLLHVFASTDLTEVIAEASPTTHPDLSDIKFEKSSQDLTGAWISYIDDGIFESSYQIPVRIPIGASYSRLTEKFEKPVTANTCIIKKVRVHIPAIIELPGQIAFSIYSNLNNYPNEQLFMSSSSEINSTGWNTFDLEYDVTDYPVFYISVPPSQNYAVSIDDNSSILNGYWWEYVSSNPPREGWVKQDRNYAIEVYLEY